MIMMIIGLGCVPSLLLCTFLRRFQPETNVNKFEFYCFPNLKRVIQMKSCSLCLRLNNLKHITCSHMLGYGFFINKLCMLNSRSFIVFQTCGFSLKAEL